jgi:hypothetical protein
VSETTLLTDLPERLAAVVIAALQTDKGVHAETAIATAAVLTGEYALRAAGLDISTLKSGEPVFSDAVNRLLFEADGQLTISDVFINALFAQGVDVSKQSWPETVPEAHQIMMDPVQVAARLRPHINNIFAAHETIDLLERAYQCASATALLVAQTRRVLDPDIGKALALEAMLKGAKTVPY